MYRVPDDIRSTRNRDGGVVLDLRCGKILRLNSTGALIVECLRHGYSEPQIVDQLSAECDVPMETIASDVSEFLRSLEERCLLCGDHPARAL